MWTTDSSAELVVNGNRLECALPKPCGNVYNGIWKEDEVGLTEGKSYWKVSLERGDRVFVGVTDSSKFGKGWGFKGLMFGGNLSSGGALLRGNFGPKPKSGDTIGILVDLDGESLRVYFDYNGAPLGLAFSVPKSTLGPLFPAVTFSGPGTVSITKSQDFPGVEAVAAGFEGMEGNWEYGSGSIKADGHRITLELKKKTSDKYMGRLIVINTVQFGLSRDDATGEIWKGQCGASTMMGGSPELMAIEGQMSKLVGGALTIENSDGALSIHNNDNNNSSLWKRFVEIKEHISVNPFL